ncbi:MAG: DUF3817 domain-containing protein [Leucobacter sp.]
MKLEPKPSDYPRIRTALNIYKVTSVVTGVMLLLLCAVMIMKYAFGVQLYLFTPDGFARFEPIPEEGIEAEFRPEGFDLFRAFLIAHGWFYVIYLISDFLLWSPMRWNFWRFILLALGGVIPFLSFFLEARIVREVNAFLASREDAEPAEPDTAANTSTSSSADRPA